MKVKAVNTGNGAAALGSATLSFRAAAGGADLANFFSVTPDAANPAGLAASDTAFLSFTVQVRAEAPLGLVQVDASLTGTDGHSGDPLRVSGASQGPAELTVRGGAERAVLRVTTVLAPAILAQGQSARVTVRVLNSGLVDAVDATAALGFTDSALADATAQFVVTPEPGNPTTLPGGEGRDFAFTVRVRATAQAGQVWLDGSAAGLDRDSRDPVGDAGADTPAAVTVKVNRRPVAQVGPEVTQRVTDPARLDATGSTDPDGDPLAFSWSLVSAPAGSRVTTGSLSVNDSGAAARPGFAPDRKGLYVWQLTVSDGKLASAPVQARVTVSNSAPRVSVATDAVEVEQGRAAALTARGSDPDSEDGLVYRWSLVARPSSSALGGSSAFAPNGSAAAFASDFTPDAAGLYLAAVTVSDGTDESLAAMVAVQAEPPPAPDELVFLSPRDGVTIQQDARSLAGVQVDVVLRTAPGKTVTLAINGTAAGSRAAGTDGKAWFRNVTLPGGRDSTLGAVQGTLTASVTVTVPANLPPRALARTPGKESAGPRMLELDGSQSFDPEGGEVAYQWRLAEKPAGAASFESTLPTTRYPARASGSYVFELRVTNPSRQTASARTLLTVEAVRPVADARGAQQVVLTRDGVPAGLQTALSVLLDGTASFAPNGASLTYEWSVERAPDVTAIGAASMDCFRARFLGNEEVACSVLEDFGRDLREQLDEMDLAFRQADPAPIRAGAHKLRGAAAFLGLPEVARLAAELEAVTGRGDLETAQRTRNALEAEYAGCSSRLGLGRPRPAKPT